ILTLVGGFLKGWPVGWQRRGLLGVDGPQGSVLIVENSSYLKPLYPMHNTSTPRSFPPPWLKGRFRWIAPVVLICTLSAAHAQEVTGRVTDSGDNSPLPGASIIVKGTSVGTTTDGNGEYRLAVEDPNATLVFSFIGYETQEIAVGGRTRIDISLLASTQAL